jgi:hypothetical protein
MFILPVERQVKEAFAQRWQNVVGSVVPASGNTTARQASECRRR